jgi:signal transduction histidine kinase
VETLLLALLVLATVAACLAAARARSLRRRGDALEEARRHLAGEVDDLRQAERGAREEAERAARSRDEFVATVSHELRTPLNAVLGWARLLRLGNLDPAAAVRAVETIERSATLQAKLVDDILDVSRILRGGLRLDVRPVELAPLVEAAADAVRPAAAARHISLVVLLRPGAGRVSGDPVRLQQVAWSLLSNAVKFSPAGGRIEVRLDRAGDDLELQVTDQGTGIDPAFLPHLFELFRQADSSSTRAYGGLGLGLAMVRHLVEAHGGTVRAESSGRGRGSTFTVRLPALPAGRTAAGQPLADVPSGPEGPWPLARLSRLRVLVVDDDPDSREVVREVLEQAGATVAVAASSREALAAIAQEPPDVLLSDLGMPEEDGYQLLRSVRALAKDAGGSVPAAALTAYTQAEDRLAAQDAGFQGYLAKPIDPAELTAAVARLAGRLH